MHNTTNQVAHRRENFPVNVNLARARAGLASAASSQPAMRLLEAQRSMTKALFQLGMAQRLRDKGLISSQDYERRALAHTVAERKLNDLLRWLNETE